MTTVEGEDLRRVMLIGQNDDGCICESDVEVTVLLDDGGSTLQIVRVKFGQLPCSA